MNLDWIQERFEMRCREVLKAEGRGRELRSSRADCAYVGRDEEGTLWRTIEGHVVVASPDGSLESFTAYVDH